MVIGYDLDGVIADENLELRKSAKTNKEKENYYLSRKLQMIPAQNSVIVTGRKEKFRSITESWLRQYRIDFSELIMFPNNYKRNNKTLSEFKADVVKRKSISVFFENDLKIAKYLKNNVSNLVVVYVFSENGNLKTEVI